MLSPARNGYLIVSGVERFDEINQMQDHNRWVSITWLSIKRTTDDWKTTEYGILRVVRGQVFPTVYDRNTDGAVARYQTFDDLLDDGWRVD